MTSVSRARQGAFVFAWSTVTAIAVTTSSSCAKQTFPLSNPPNGTTIPVISGVNVLPLTVNGSTCSNPSYSNKPCVSVTVCDTSASNCQVINDLLLDTGSYGLRIFKTVLTTFVPVLQTQGPKTVTECVEYGDGSSQWGPVASVDVVLGGEPAVTVPIQLIDSTATGASNCGTPDTSPSEAGFNGILGVGLFASDCGGGCAQIANNGWYFGCNGGTCTGITVTTANQVQNPVALLPTDNNGVILELPNIGLGGVTSLSGYLALGIGTRSNNVLTGVTTFQADSNYGEFSTTYNGTSYSSFLDSGSNGLYFPETGLIDCKIFSKTFEGFFCPLFTQSFTANNTGNSGKPTTTSSFQIGNAYSLINGSNNVFVELGGTTGSTLGSVFDWGLPFYIGRNVAVGLANTTSNLGTGPYWSY